MRGARPAEGCHTSLAVREALGERERASVRERARGVRSRGEPNAEYITTIEMQVCTENGAAGTLQLRPGQFSNMQYLSAVLVDHEPESFWSKVMAP